MITLFKEVKYNLETLIQNIHMGIIGLPDIQRPFVWSDTKTRNLFDSMYRGYPIGYLLFWSNKLEGDQRQIGTDSKQKHPDLLIVDGQQRLTSLYAVLKGIPIIRENYKKERIYIAFKPSEEKFEVADAAIKRSAEYIHDISKLWDPDTDLYDFTEDFLNKLKETREILEEEQRNIRKSINKLQGLRHYPFTALELSSNINEEQVAEIFVRINSEGKTLNMADFILTLMSVFWDKGRADLEKFCGSSREPSTGTASAFNYHLHPDPDNMLRVGIGLGFRRARLKYAYSILRGKDLETEKFSEELRDQQFAILKEAQAFTLDIQNWHEYLKCLKLAGFLNKDTISSTTTILYGYIFFLIGKRDYGVGHDTLRNLIARWFFMSALTGRYTGSPETVMEQDLVRLREIKTAEEFIQTLNKIIKDNLTEDYWKITLANELDSSSPRGPSLFAYYAALNILGASGLFSHLKVSELLESGLRAKKSALERHHLFPKNYLKKIGVNEVNKQNQIANFALVEWADNIDISDESPASYLSKYIKRFNEEDLKKMYYWHALPQDWEKMEYPEFLEHRRKLIAQVIRDGFEKLNS